MKEKRIRTILYGNSVILATVGASLQRHTNLEVISLLPPLPDVQKLSELDPDVIFYDVEASLPVAAVTLMETCPNLLLIGVSPENDQVLLWSRRQLRAVSSQDLIQVISQNEPNS